MSYEEMVAVLDDYLEMEINTWHKPSWFECLSFLAGYFNTINVDMVMAVRKRQREGKVDE